MAGGFDSGFDSGFDIQVEGASRPTTLGTGDDEPLDSLKRPLTERLLGVLDTVSRRYAELVATAVSILGN